MISPSAKMLVSVGKTFACMKIAGRANFTSSIDFKALFDELLAKQYAWFVLDLTDCVLMDSTFLGVLAGLGLKVNGPQADHTTRTLELFNPNVRIQELLENLGVLHLFKISQGQIKFPEITESREVTPANPSHEEAKLTCLEAHQILMEINPENVSKFKELTQFLAEDLKKLKGVR